MLITKKNSEYCWTGWCIFVNGSYHVAIVVHLILFVGFKGSKLISK